MSAKIYTDESGAIVQVLHNAAEEAANPTPPSSSRYMLQFDETTNAALLADIDANLALYRYFGKRLTRGSIVNYVDVTPDADEATRRRNLWSLIRALQNGVVLTNNQLDLILAYLLRASMGGGTGDKSD